MTLPRLLLVWFVGLFVALGFSLPSENLAMAGTPAEIRVGIDEQGLLHLTPAVNGQRVAFSLQRDETTGQMIITSPAGQVNLPQPLREEQNRFVLNTGQGQLELVLPEQGQPLDLELAYAERGSRLLLKAESNLEVVGADLAGSLILQTENRLALGPGFFKIAGDLSLLAGQTLHIRDQGSHPLLVQVEGQLTLQGHQAVDIFALSHPASALMSGGDMVLRSLQPVRGDAHYLAGGQFRIEQLDGHAGHLVSPYDPIILANQNVSLGSYTGASLHILAGGSVTLSSVTITGNDTAANTINPANATLFNGLTPIGSLASFNLSDGTPVTINGNTQPTLDVRAGVAWGTFSGGAPANQVIPSGALVPTFSGPAANAGITVGNITVSPPNGVVLLTNQYRPNGLSGDITAGNINTGTASPGGNGGVVLIDTRDNLTAGSLNTAANVAGSAANSGGEVRVIAEGNISLTGVSTFARSFAATAGNGGNVTIQAGGTLNDISISSYAESVTGSGNAGDINITASGSLTLTNLQSYSRFSGAGFAGDAGDVSILVKNTGPLDGGDDLRLNYLWSDSGAWYFGSAVGPSGNGGNVSLVTEDGDVISNEWIWVQTLARGGTNNSGNGGDIAVTATNGGITIGNFGLNSRTEAASGSSGNTGQSGDITLIAEGDIDVNSTQNTGGILADSRVLAGTAQGSGTVLLQSSSGAIDFGVNGVNVQSFSNGGQAGSAGGITLEAAGDINVRFLQTHSQSSNGGSLAGNAGPVLVTGGGNINLPNEINSFAEAQAGTAGNGGNITIQAGGLFTSTNINSYVQSAAGSGNAGDMNITATGPLTLTNLQSYTRFSGAGSSGDSGDVSILVKNTGPLDGGDDLHLNFIWSDSGAWYFSSAVGPSGNGADISLMTEDGDVIFDNWIWVQTLARGGVNNSGNGGDVTITATNGGFSVGDFGLNTQSQVASGGSGNAGKGGNVTIIAAGTIANPTFGGIEARSTALAGNSSEGGAIMLQSTSSDIDFGSEDLIALSQTNSGPASNGGSITLEADGTITAGDIRSQSASNSGEAGSAGPVELLADNDIQVTSINATALGGAGHGPGGKIIVETNQFFRVTGLLSSSIANQGLANSSTITITHGGGGITPFIVGDAATNGTAGAITTGDALLNPTQPYFYTHFEAPNLWLISVPSPLAIDKLVTPSTNAPYHGAITYTITLSNNSGVPANGMLLTDTLPGPVDFDHWVQQPAGAGVAAGQLTWNGTVPANGQVIFSFVASHTGVYSQVVTNTASFFHPASGGEGSDGATFVAEPDPWLILGSAPLAISKLVTPSAGVPYHGAVTYTITLSNSSGVPANGMLLTDTLPGPVNFHHWLQKPTGAGIAAGQLTWNGTVPANGQVIFSFVASHTGVYSQVVTNTASFSHPASGGQKSDGATFVVEPEPGNPSPPQNKVYIPLLLK